MDFHLLIIFIINFLIILSEATLTTKLLYRSVCFDNISYFNSTLS